MDHSMSARLVPAECRIFILSDLDGTSFSATRDRSFHRPHALKHW
jgi:hypothetical protein